MKNKEKLWLTSIATILVLILVSSVASASDVQNATSTNNTSSSATWLTSPGLNTQEQGIYHRPIDHQWHSGPTYHYNDFFEWHYFTFLGKDKTTGHNVSLFVLNNFQGYRTDIQRPNTRIITAYLDKDKGKFYGNTIQPTSQLVTKGSNGDFNYVVNDTDQGFSTYYNYSQERWNFKGWATNQSTMAAGTPYNVNVTGIVKAPGYVPMAYWGLENIGFNNKYNQNPSTMYGLSYYYTAPEMEITGNVTMDDGVVHQIEGTAWFEHQWGNYQSPEQARYFWGYARFPNGDTMTWRQYYDSPAGIVPVTPTYNLTAAAMAWNASHVEQNRFAFIPKGQPPQYSFGPEFVFTPIKWWTSPVTGNSYPWYGELNTPKGMFYITPSATPSQESTGAAGSFIEGAMELHSGSIDGPIAAGGFCELVQLPPLGAPNNRGLPEASYPGDIRFDGGLNHSAMTQN